VIVTRDPRPKVVQQWGKRPPPWVLPPRPQRCLEAGNWGVFGQKCRRRDGRPIKTRHQQTAPLAGISYWLLAWPRLHAEWRFARYLE